MLNIVITVTSFKMMKFYFWEVESGVNQWM